MVSFFQTLLRHQATQQVEEALFLDAPWRQTCSPKHCLKSSTKRVSLTLRASFASHLANGCEEGCSLLPAVNGHLTVPALLPDLREGWKLGDRRELSEPVSLQRSLPDSHLLLITARPSSPSGRERKMGPVQRMRSLELERFGLEFQCLVVPWLAVRRTILKAEFPHP